MTFLELTNHIKSVKCSLNTNATFIISIDGRCGSGKSTLASELANALGAQLIHADDFFLPLNLRTPERLCEPGGNFHYERFTKEILQCIKNGKTFTYQRFDCSKMELGEFCEVKAADYTIIEGSYSQHPKLPDYADLKIFLSIDEKEQMLRIIKRNGSEKAKIFKSKWIPLEEAYFLAHNIEKKADLFFYKNFEFKV